MTREQWLAEFVVTLRQARTRAGLSYGTAGSRHFRRNSAKLLVDFEPTAPAVYIVPSATIATILAKWFQVWVTTPGARGQQRNRDNPMRRLLPDMGRGVTSGPPGWLDAYRDLYKLLGEPGAAPSV
jgi:hypothetical protein